MKKYYSYLDNNDKLVENSYFASNSPKNACRKIFGRYLRGVNEDTKLNIVVVDLKNQKRHYYCCVGEYLAEPIMKLVDENRKRFVTIRYKITLVKIIKEMMEYV